MPSKQHSSITPSPRTKRGKKQTKPRNRGADNSPEPIQPQTVYSGQSSIAENSVNNPVTTTPVKKLEEPEPFAPFDPVFIPPTPDTAPPPYTPTSPNLPTMSEPIAQPSQSTSDVPVQSPSKFAGEKPLFSLPKLKDVFLLSSY